MMKNLRMSRNNHATHRQDNPQRDMSGLRGAGTVHVSVDPNVGSGLAPKKFRPFLTYPMTGTPKAAESDGKGEGGKHRKSK